PEFVNYRPRATVAEFQRVLRRELDFGREERNMQQFYREFADNPSVKIPHVYVDLSTSRVLTMEYIKGIKLSQCHQVAAAGFELDQVARRGAELYLEMIFTHGFYHADPHAGNILLLDGNVIGLLDYGMVGRIDEALREEMEDLLMSIIRQDDVSLTAVIMRVGEVPLDLDENALRGELADFVSHYGNQPMATFRLASALNEMMEIIRRFQIMLPAQIALLLKTLVMLEGTARTLNPEFSLIEVMAPFQRKLLRRRLSPARRLKKIRRTMFDLEQLISVMPRRVSEILNQVKSGKFDVHLDHRGLEPSVNRLVLGMLASALFLGSSMMLTFKVWPVAFEKISVPGALGCFVSLMVGLRLLRAINKSGHLDRRD
ncbi:MAG TPA: AarF/UbiB family protein, partial [Pirellulales bacterium]|nr:AarF/UbiB family protein [Pirellulales bacterium]